MVNFYYKFVLLFATNLADLGHFNDAIIKFFISLIKDFGLGFMFQKPWLQITKTESLFENHLFPNGVKCKHCKHHHSPHASR